MAKSTLTLLAATASTEALAHADAGVIDMPPGWLSAWTLDPLIIGLFSLSLVLYGRGLWRLWGRAGVGRGIGIPQAGSFAGGMLLLFFAMIWPLDALGEWLLAAHMGQHMLLMAAAAPLIIIGLPLVIMLNALPRRVVRSLATWSNTGPGRSLGVLLANTTLATGLQTATLWLWHAPAVYQAALLDNTVHNLMHAGFFGAGLWFWWSLARSIRSPHPGFGPGMVALVTTMMQMGLLGALLTFAPRPLYPFYRERVTVWGLTLLQDQQLAGLIMWVPASLPYLIGGLALFAAWLRRVARHDAGATG